MNAALAWSNLVSYSLQIGLLVAVASVIPGMLRMRLPKVKLLYWQVLLAACLVLPLTRPWRQTMVSLTTPPDTPTPRTRKPAQPAPPPTNPWTPAQAALLLLAAGAAGRMLCLGAGFWKLRRYRHHSTPWRDQTAHFGARRPEYRVSDDIGSPVTFGVAQPVVLLPRKFLDLPPRMQDAILCHETLHVERRDWVFTVAEELVRSVFWFHPAIWWLLGEIQLAREQAVDREVVERTQARDAYVDALLAVAGARLETDLALAPLFLRKRHLKQRVVTIVKETGMSKLRAMATMTAGLAMLVAAGWFVTAVFPLAAEPQFVADGPGITVDLMGAQLMHRMPVQYPVDLIGKGIQGTVIVQVKLAADGTVMDASVVSGPDELRKQVLRSVLDWHFSRSEGGSTRQISINFQPPALEQVTAPKPVITRSIPDAGSVVLRHIIVQGLSDSAQTELLAALPVHDGETLTRDAILKAIDAARAFDSHLMVTTRVDRLTGEQDLLIMAPGNAGTVVRSTDSALNPGTVTTAIAPPPPPAPSTSQTPTPPKRVVIGANVQAAMLVYGPKPEYPPLAKQARISGTVQLHAIIGPDGFIESLQVIPPAHPLLAPAAVEAVKQWQYKPTLLNGAPVEVETTIDVSFMLSQ